MTPLDHLHEAHGLLAATRAHWHTAEINLRWLQGDGLPTGHQATARLDNDQDPPPDECRTALAEARRLMHEILAHYGALIGQRLARPDDLGILLHACCRWHVHVTALVRDDPTGSDTERHTCRDIHQAAIELHRLTLRWARSRPWTCEAHGRLGCAPCNGLAGSDPAVGLAVQDWCTNHLRFQLFEPVAPQAAESLCEFCWSFRRATGKRPDERIIHKRHRQQRLTADDVGAA